MTPDWDIDINSRSNIRMCGTCKYRGISENFATLALCSACFSRSPIRNNFKTSPSNCGIKKPSRVNVLIDHVTIHAEKLDEICQHLSNTEIRLVKIERMLALIEANMFWRIQLQPEKNDQMIDKYLL